MTCTQVDTSTGTGTGGAGTLWEVRIGIYRLPWAGEFSEAVLTDLANAANLIIEPLGYKYQKATFGWADDYHGVASLWYEETGTPAIPVLAILAIGVLLAVGFLIISVDIYKWLGSNSTLSDTKAQTSQDAEKALTDAYNSGKITYDQYIAGIKNLQDALKSTDWGTAAIGVAVVLGLAFIFGNKKSSRS